MVNEYWISSSVIQHASIVKVVADSNDADDVGDVGVLTSNLESYCLPIGDDDNDDDNDDDDDDDDDDDTLDLFSDNLESAA